jgi:hypothetical protein
MKTFPSTRGAALALLLSCLATSAVRAELSNPGRTVEVTYDNPESFTDSRLSDDQLYRDSIFPAINSFLSQQSARLLPAGYRLKVSFTDIDLGHRLGRKASGFAGGAPAFEFTYQVTDASGVVVRQGSENLKFYTDFGNYGGSVSTTDLTTEIIQEEKPMLKHWAVTALGGLRKPISSEDRDTRKIRGSLSVAGLPGSRLL